ncbi:MAG: hypothetical protein Q7K55_08395 [Candidatus Levybacteria bacterium]|nr:hypothetical protein [Candidatus Levybacteria bacterium]
MKKTLVIPLVLILITLPTLLPFFNTKFFYTQDYIFIARLQQMSTALSSGQFPVRWAPDLRYGEPLFNYYAPLPYYAGAVIHLLGFNFIWVAKILFMLSAFLSAAAMYLLANYLFGKRAGLLAATLYVYAPYRAVDMYVRGALSETWAFIFLPLIFYSSAMIAKKASFKKVGLLSLSLAGLFLTHNVTTLMFLPFLFFWWIYLIIREKSRTVLLYFFLASLLGFGLAAFFLLPAFFEDSFIQTKYLTVGYFNFRAHFVAVRQLFSLFWGYGSSVWGFEDGLSFQVGLVNFAVLATAAVLAVFRRRDKKFLILISLLGISFLFSIFLQHNKSAFIWEVIPLMAFIQFPWRFLGISIFIVSLAGGVIAPYLKNKLLPVYFILIISAVISTTGYFKPKEYKNDSFFDKFLQTETMHKGYDLTKDYLPIWVQDTDGERFNIPRAETGEIKVSNLKQKSTKLDFSVVVATNSSIEVPVTYFPGWEVKAGDRVIPQTPSSNTGLIMFDLPKGDYRVKVELKDTPVRSIGNVISIISWLIILVLFSFRKRYLNA